MARESPRCHIISECRGRKAGPANLVRWLTNPASIDPHTAMPIMGISETEARIVATYLLEK